MKRRRDRSRASSARTGSRRNGDTANKIGTYPLAIAARHHGIPFYVAAPASTFDAATTTGEEILIEQRSADEVRCGFGVADRAGRGGECTTRRSTSRRPS